MFLLQLMNTDLISFTILLNQLIIKFLLLLSRSVIQTSKGDLYLGSLEGFLMLLLQKWDLQEILPLIWKHSFLNYTLSNVFP